MSGNCKRIQRLYADLYQPATRQIQQYSQLTMNLIKSCLSNHLTKMAIIVRSDLKLTKGKTASQCCHAACLCYQKSLENQPKLAKTWTITGQAKIILKVDSLEALEELHVKAKKLGIISTLVHDAGRTQIAAGTTTALGLGPDTQSRIDEIVKDLKLL